MVSKRYTIQNLNIFRLCNDPQSSLNTLYQNPQDHQDPQDLKDIQDPQAFQDPQVISYKVALYDS